MSLSHLHFHHHISRKNSRTQNHLFGLGTLFSDRVFRPFSDEFVAHGLSNPFALIVIRKFSKLPNDIHLSKRDPSYVNTEKRGTFAKVFSSETEYVRSKDCLYKGDDSIGFDVIPSNENKAGVFRMTLEYLENFGRIGNPISSAVMNGLVINLLLPLKETEELS